MIKFTFTILNYKEILYEIAWLTWIYMCIFSTTLLSSPTWTRWLGTGEGGGLIAHENCQNPGSPGSPLWCHPCREKGAPLRPGGCGRLSSHHRLHWHHVGGGILIAGQGWKYWQYSHPSLSSSCIRVQLLSVWWEWRLSTLLVGWRQNLGVWLEWALN